VLLKVQKKSAKEREKKPKQRFIACKCERGRRRKDASLHREGREGGVYESIELSRGNGFLLTERGNRERVDLARIGGDCGKRAQDRMQKGRRKKGRKF